MAVARTLDRLTDLTRRSPRSPRLEHGPRDLEPIGEDDEFAFELTAVLKDDEDESVVLGASARRPRQNGSDVAKGEESPSISVSTPCDRGNGPAFPAIRGAEAAQGCHRGCRCAPRGELAAHTDRRTDPEAP